MLHLGHMLALGIKSSSNLFMWHPTVNLAYSIPHLMNHRTIHRNIKEKLPKNIKSEKKWRKWEKVKKSEKLRKSDLALTRQCIFWYWPPKNQKHKLKKLRKLEKMFPGKNADCNLGWRWNNASKTWHRSGLYDCVTPCSFTHFFICTSLWYFSPMLSMINLNSPIGYHMNNFITYIDLQKTSPLSLPSHETNTSYLIHKWKKCDICIVICLDLVVTSAWCVL